MASAKVNTMSMEVLGASAGLFSSFPAAFLIFDSTIFSQWKANKEGKMEL